MKRAVVIILICVLVVLSTCACESEATSDLLDTAFSTTDPAEEAVTESLCEQLMREIDIAYHKAQELPENGTTVGMVDLADSYAEQWKQVANVYYDKILKYDGIAQLKENQYSSDDLHTFVVNMKTNWEAYYQVQCENYVKTLQTIYGSGTIVGPVFADYKYEMQKEWALQLVGIYQQLNAE